MQGFRPFTAVSVSTSVSTTTHNVTDDMHGHNEYQHIYFIMQRAYQHLYGMNLPEDPAYQQPIFDATLQLRRDVRSRGLSEKALLKACEDIIRISDEHYRLAQQHQARATNPVYLRETALDNALEQEKYQQAISEIMPQPRVATTRGVALDGRVSHRRDVSSAPTSAEMMELAYQQLMHTIQQNRG